MEFIYTDFFLNHKSENHPECPERLFYFKRNCKETSIESGEQYLPLVYSKNYIKKIKDASKHEEYLDGDTYTNKFSFESACYSAGSAILASDTNNFSLGRPPGHHATKSRPMGFCLFNNIAIAAQKLVNEGKRVFILDIDSHHGNGTQDIFYESSDALYLSLHQFPAYPGTGWLEEIGSGSGEGYTVNIPLPAYSADDLFLESLAFWIPIVKEQFKPDIVAVSAGFDGHHSDPLLQLNLTTNAYHETGKLLSKNFKSIFASLEGGYNLEYLHKCIIDFSNGILGKKQQFMEEKTVSDRDVVNGHRVRMMLLKENLKNYWRF